MDANEIASTLRDAADAVRVALAAFEGAGPSGEREGQYALDLVADDAVCDVLLRAGLAVFSEESGKRGEGPIVVVVDPVDGSTNADRGIPFYSISLCAMDEAGPVVSMVENLVTRDVFAASRGRGATKNGSTIRPQDTRASKDAIVGVNGVLTHRPGWAQVRTLGSAALELCLVADGSLDGYVQVGGAAIHPWDYLAGLHIVQEAGGAIRSIDGDELIVQEDVPRRPLAAATEVLADELLSDLRSIPG